MPTLTVIISPNEVVPFTLNVPVTIKLSSIVVVPPEESMIKLPVRVSISLSPVSAILILPICASENLSADVPRYAPRLTSGMNPTVEFVSPVIVTPVADVSNFLLLL